MLNAIQYLSETTGRRYFPQRGYVNTQRIPRIPFYPTVKLYPFSPGAECKSDEQESKKEASRREREKGAEGGGGGRGGGREKARGTWWIFQRSQSEGSNSVKGLSNLFFETRNRGSFRVTLLERHAKTTRDSLESCAHACASVCEPSRAKIWSGANASSLTLHLHFADVKIAPGPLIRICIFEASRGALPFP